MKKLAAIMAGAALMLGCASHTDHTAMPNENRTQEQKRQEFLNRMLTESKKFYTHIFDKYENAIDTAFDINLKNDERKDRYTLTKRDLEIIHLICQERYPNDKKFLSQYKKTIEEENLKEINDALKIISTSITYEYAINFVNLVIDKSEPEYKRYRILEYWISQRDFKPITKQKYTVLRNNYLEILGQEESMLSKLDKTIPDQSYKP